MGEGDLFRSTEAGEDLFKVSIFFGDLVKAILGVGLGYVAARMPAAILADDVYWERG